MSVTYHRILSRFFSEFPRVVFYKKEKKKEEEERRKKEEEEGRKKRRKVPTDHLQRRMEVGA